MSENERLVFLAYDSVLNFRIKMNYDMQNISFQELKCKSSG